MAAERRQSLAKVVEESVRLFLNEQRIRRADPPGDSLPLLSEPEVQADLDLNDTSRLWELE